MRSASAGIFFGLRWREGLQIICPRISRPWSIWEYRITERNERTFSVKRRFSKRLTGRTGDWKVLEVVKRATADLGSCPTTHCWSRHRPWHLKTTESYITQSEDEFVISTGLTWDLGDLRVPCCQDRSDELGKSERYDWWTGINILGTLGIQPSLKFIPCRRENTLTKAECSLTPVFWGTWCW